MRRFWPWLRPHRRYLWVVLGLLVLSTPLALVAPLIIRRVVDDAVSSHTEDVFFWGGILIAITVANVGITWIVRYAQTIFQTKVFRDVRLRLHKHMRRLSLRYYADRETGFLLSRQVDDVHNLHGVMADSIGKAIIAGVQGIGYAIMLFYVEWRMAAAGLVFVAVIFGFEWAISARLRALSKRSRETWTEVTRNLHQALSGHALVQATSAEQREDLRYARVLHTSVRARLKHALLGIVSGQVLHLIGGLGPPLIILGGAYLIVVSDFTIGGLFAFFMYLMRLFGSVNQVAGMNPALQNSLASLERVFEVLDTEPEVTDRPDSPRIPADEVVGRVRFERVSFAYREGRPVLTDVDLDVEERTFVALVGPSGSGKTTLARLVSRFYDPTEGRVLVDGIDVRDYELRSYRRIVGLVPQDVFLFDRSVAENIAFGTPRATRAEIEDAAAAAEALEFIQDLPDGFDTAIGERGVRLSGGQRQRIAIARELLRDPRILILDEATSSLDSESEARIQLALDKLLAGRTAFVIAHRLSTVRRADRIVVLDAGRIVEHGTHPELLAASGLYRRLHDWQFRAAE